MDSPWSDSDTLSIPNGMVRLSKEILDFEKYIAPTESETRKRSEAQKTVKDFIRKVLPEEYTIEVFGSHVTTLTFPSSDIDFNIQFKYPVVKPTPVIKCKLDNGVSVDITVQNPAPSSDRTIAWIKQYPELKPLFMVLKQALSSFRVNHKKNFEPLSAKFSGLASFGLICLIVSYLQMHKPIDKSPNDPDYYACLLLGFLDYYSTFDASKYIICVKDKGRYYSVDEETSLIKVNYEEGKLFVINPDEPDRNVCGALSCFDILQSLFKYASNSLKARIENNKKPKSALSSIIVVQPHKYGEPRNELDNFQSEYIYISRIGQATDYPANNRSQKRQRQDEDDDYDEKSVYRDKRTKTTYSSKKYYDDRRYRDDKEYYPREYRRPSYRRSYEGNYNNKHVRF
ncbi:hypothetical protein G6F46_002213 [Rhizopus delemar]|nr:hypothetical protein G6F46_002213 [Rhizopus delemar]KAG1644199.1 hypothetical protein G6F44_003068 [Rhizopus delemar]